MSTENTQQVDLDNIPMDKLRELADQESSGQTPDPDPAAGERKRDEMGRFVAENSHTNDEEETVDPADQPDEEPEVTVYRKEIDLGDGSGVQVFTATSVDELLDKLATAQAHATKKIRELNNRIKAIESAKPEEKELTPDEEFVLSQQLQSNPSKVLRKAVNDEIERRERVQKDNDERNAATAQEFITRNPEYLPTPANGTKLFRFLQTYKLDPTVENLERAYTELNESGLLEVRPAASEEKGVTVDTETDTDTARIEQPVESPKVTEPTQRKKAASGLSSRGTTVARPTKATGPTEDELYSMPMEKLRELAQRQARQS